MFFAYIGFDAISTAAEETTNPQRNLPIGILGGLAICTVIYVVVGAVLTGMVPYKELAVADPLARALELAGFKTVGWFVALGAAVSDVRGAARLPVRPAAHLLRDGAATVCCRKWAAKLRIRRPRIPSTTTIITGVFVASWALIGDAAETYDLTNIGTLFAFMLVSIGVLVLRYKEPDRPRPFKVPFVVGGLPAVGRRLRLHHARPAADGMGAVRGLAGDWPGAYFYATVPQQPPARYELRVLDG